MFLRSRTVGSLLLALALALAACGGGGGGGGATEAASLAGSVRDENGVGLESVDVTVSGPTTLVTAGTRTDANGDFIVFAPPLGTALVRFDGSGSSSPGTFAPLALPLTLAEGANDLTRSIVLPDLDQGTTLVVDVDGNGATTALAVIQADAQTLLEIPGGTTLRLDGVTAVGSLAVNLTTVRPESVPVPLPVALDPRAFVTLQPEGASFDHGLDGQGRAQGAALVLPNERNLPAGTAIDLWCFEPATGAWVNRSEETGNHGTVAFVGGNLALVVNGAVTSGGLHAAAVPVDPECATTLAGRVVDPGGSPVPGVLVTLTTGQSGVTGTDGTFTLPAVTAYDGGAFPDCTTLDLGLRLLAPVAYGSVARTEIVLGGTLALGATTELGDLELAVLATGSLVGRVSDGGVGQEGSVSLTGPLPATNVQIVASSPTGTFFAASLAPGTYGASFPFASGTSSTGFVVRVHETTVLDLEPPASGDTLSVLVFDPGAGNAEPRPVAGARVTLQDSGGGTVGTTNLAGIASFAEGTGPFTVTAQLQRTTGPFVQRFATSLVGVAPVDGTIALPFLGLPPTNASATEASVHGTIANIPAGALVLVDVSSNQVPGGFESFAFADENGAYSIAVPANVPFDVSVQAFDAPPGAQFATGLAAAPGAQLERNFDFAGGGFVPFDVIVPLTYTHAPSGADVTGSAILRVRGAGELVFLAVAEESAGAPPATVLLPNLSRPQFAGVFRALEVRALVTDAQTADADVVSCTIPLTATPPTLAVPFVGAANNVQPADLETFACSREDCLDLAGEIFALELGASVPGLAQGFNVFDIDRGPDDVSSEWKILVAPGATSAGLPRIAPELPMFTDGSYDLGLEIVRFSAANFDFATFFDAGVAAKLRAVNRASTVCSTESDSRFGVTTPPGPGLAFRAGRGPTHAEALRAAVADERARRAARSPAVRR